MDRTLNALNAEDRAHVESILARYGLQGDTHMRGNLVVPPNVVFHLQHGSPAGGTHLLLVTNDLDQVKRWIGTPDAAFESEPFELTPPSADDYTPKGMDELSPAQLDTLADAVRHYVFGDSRNVRAFKEGIEAAFAPFETKVYIYTTLEIAGTLKFTDPSALILANTIMFKPGGVLQSTGNLSIQATYIVTQA